MIHKQNEKILEQIDKSGELIVRPQGAQLLPSIRVTLIYLCPQRGIKVERVSEY